MTMKKIMLITTLGLLLGACSSTPDPTLLDLTMTADADLNPDLASRPSPMVVKLVEIKSHTAFENADYFSLVGNTKSVLGPDFVAEETLPIRPGERKQFKLRMHPDAGFIGVIAEYRTIDKAVWRYVLQPKIEDFSDIRLALTKDAIRPMTDTKYDNKKKDGMSVNTAQVQQHASIAQSGYNMATGTSPATNAVSAIPVK